MYSFLSRVGKGRAGRPACAQHLIFLSIRLQAVGVCAATAAGTAAESCCCCCCCRPPSERPAATEARYSRTARQITPKVERLSVLLPPCGLQTQVPAAAIRGGLHPRCCNWCCCGCCCYSRSRNRTLLRQLQQPRSSSAALRPSKQNGGLCCCCFFGT